MSNCSKLRMSKITSADGSVNDSTRVTSLQSKLLDVKMSRWFNLNPLAFCLCVCLFFLTGCIVWTCHSCSSWRVWSGNGRVTALSVPIVMADTWCGLSAAAILVVMTQSLRPYHMVSHSTCQLHTFYLLLASLTHFGCLLDVYHSVLHMGAWFSHSTWILNLGCVVLCCYASSISNDGWPCCNVCLTFTVSGNVDLHQSSIWFLQTAVKISLQTY